MQEVLDGLAQRGHDVTLFTARYDGSVAREKLASGVEVVRAGSRLGVYPSAALAYLRGRLGRPDVVLDIQNGVPFFSRLWARRPATVILSHHVHEAQWSMVFGPVVGRVGWWIESRLSPWLHRGLPYATISEASKIEHVRLGVRADDMTVVIAGVNAREPLGLPRSSRPTLISIGRLVPHKRVEWTIDAVAALASEIPDLTLHIVGDGWWAEELRAHASAAGVEDRVQFHGFVDEDEKRRLLAESWVALLPSTKEGWGLVVSEAGMESTPTIAFESAGGVTESIAHGVSGVLVADESVEGLVAATRSLLADPDVIDAMGVAAVAHASQFTWKQTIDDFEALLGEAAAARSRRGLPAMPPTTASLPSNTPTEAAAGPRTR